MMIHRARKLAGGSVPWKKRVVEGIFICLVEKRNRIAAEFEKKLGKGARRPLWVLKKGACFIMNLKQAYTM